MDNPYPKYLGKGRDTPFSGFIDEVRLIPTLMSSNWIWSSWSNQAPNSVFVNYGRVQPYVKGPFLRCSTGPLTQDIWQGANGTTQTVEVWNAGIGTLQYTVATDPVWITATPTNGTSTGEHDRITISYQTAAFGSGNYTGSVTIAATNGDGSPQTIPVAITVKAPYWECSLSNLTQLGLVGQCLSQCISVRYHGNGATSYTVSNNIPWSSETPVSGTNAGEWDGIQVDYATDGLGAGDHTGEITIAASQVTNPPSIRIPVILRLCSCGDWPLCSMISFPGYDRSEPLTNFPVLVVFGANMPGFSYGQFASTNAADLRFVNFGETNELCYEIEQWNTNGSSYVWVRVPALTPTNLPIVAMWGKTNQALPAYTTNGATWANGYRVVWHLAETNGPVRDSTGRGNTGTPYGGVTQGVQGMVDGADSFDGTNDYILAGQNLGISGDAEFTMEAWIYWDGAAWIANYPAFMGMNNPGTTDHGLAFTVNFRISAVDFWWNRVHTVNALNVQQWYHVVGTKRPGTKSANTAIYVNGSPVAVTLDGLTDAPPNIVDAPFVAGRLDGTANRWFEGLIDEVRFSDTARSANWVYASWLNQASNGVFTQYGPVTPTRPVLAVSPLLLTVSTFAGTNAPDGTFDVWNDGIGSFSYTIATDAVWMAAIPSSGTNSGEHDQIIVEYATATLPVGTYTGRVTVAAEGIEGSACVVTNVLTVKAPYMETSVSSLEQSAWVGENPAAQSFRVRYEGNGTANYAVTTDVAWLSVSPTNGSNTGRWDQITVSYQTTNMGAATYTGAICIASDQASNSPVVIPVTLCLRLRPGCYEIGVTFGGYARGEALTNFPALVVLSTNIPGFRYDQFAGTNGADLRFADLDLNELNYELEQWNTNGNSYVWVQVPLLSGTNTQILAFWGNPAASRPAYTTNGATWANGYRVVWHLAETNGPVRDSTGRGNNGTVLGGVNRKGQGKVDGAYVFDGTDGYVLAGQNLGISGDAEFTMEAWIYWTAPAWGVNYPAFMGMNNPGTADQGLSFTVNGGCPGVDFWYNRVRAVNALSVGQWYHVVGTKKPGTKAANTAIYVNGSPVPMTLEGTDAPPHIADAPFVVGRLDATTNRYFDGLIDEVRFSDQARSPNWVYAFWLNQASNGVFTQYGPVKGPYIETSVRSLEQSAWVGENPATQSFLVRYEGNGTANYAVTTDVAWLSVSPTNGSNTGQWDQITVSYQTTNMGAGDVHGSHQHCVRSSEQLTGCDSRDIVPPVASGVLRNRGYIWRLCPR